MTTQTIPPSGGPAPMVSPAGRGAALPVLTFGAFVVGTGEFAILGMLPEFASPLHLSTPAAGHAFTAYPLWVSVGAPPIHLLAAVL